MHTVISIKVCGTNEAYVTPTAVLWLNEHAVYVIRMACFQLQGPAGEKGSMGDSDVWAYDERHGSKVTILVIFLHMVEIRILPPL